MPDGTGFGYLMQWTNVEGNLCEVRIYDPNGGPFEMGYELTPSQQPFQLFVDNTGEDKFSPIRAVQAEIRFLSSDASESMLPFTTRADGGWKVEYRIASTLHFTGFLVQDDITQDFLDDDIGNEVVLTATDNIGLLKDVPLTDFNGQNPRGKQSLIQLLAWALVPTGLDLNIKAVNSIRLYELFTETFYTAAHVDAKTFEREIGVSEDCYTVLQKILGENCYLTQQAGAWWIIRVDEVERDNYTVHTYNSAGVYQGSATEQRIQLIGKDETIYFSGDGTRLMNRRPIGELLETYVYEYPKEIIENIDFVRGRERAGGTDSEKTYLLDDWYLSKGSILSRVTGTGSVYIKRIFTDNVETERYVKIEPAGAFHWLESSSIPILNKDKGHVSVDFRGETNITSSGNAIHGIAVILHGNDGSKWIFGGQPEGSGTTASEIKPAWRILQNDVHQYNRVYLYWRLEDEDESQWRTLAGEIEAAPTDGDLYILLTCPLGGNTYYQNLQFTYQPYINGSYQTFKGQEHKIENRTFENKARRDEQVFLSDSPRPLFKGSLFYPSATEAVYTGSVTLTADRKLTFTTDVTRFVAAGQRVVLAGTASNNSTFTIAEATRELDGTSYLIVDETVTAEAAASATLSRYRFTLASNFYNGAVYAAPPALTFVHPYGHLQAFDVWNQYNRPFRGFEFQCQGLTADLPTLIHQYRLTAATPHTTGKRFALLHMEQDHLLCEWRGVLIELYDDAVAKDYSSTKTFKYITER